MQVRNPHFDDPVQTFAENNAQQIDTYLANNAGERAISFDQIRADFPNVTDPRTGTAPMTDGTIEAVFKHLGYKVTE